MTATTELTVIERAKQVLAFDETKAKLAELAKSSARIDTITNAAGREECHAALMALSRPRIDIEKLGKAARSDANAFRDAVIAAEKELIAIVTPEEARLRKLRDDWDAAREAEKAAAIAAELSRVEGIKESIQQIKDIPSWMPYVSNGLEEQIESLSERAILESEFAEFTPQAEVAKSTTLARLIDMHKEAVAAEAEAKRIADEQAAAAEQLRKDREELERLRTEAAERQAKADAEAKTARDEADRVAEEQRKRDAEAQRVQMEAEAAERRAQEEADRAERAEQDRIDREERDRQTAELKAHQDAAAEELRVERAKLAEQAAELKRQQDEQAARDKAARDTQIAMERKAEYERLQQEIATATLRDAATEAVGLLTELGEGDHITTRKLASALARENS